MCSSCQQNSHIDSDNTPNCACAEKFFYAPAPNTDQICSICGIDCLTCQNDDPNSC